MFHFINIWPKSSNVSLREGNNVYRNPDEKHLFFFYLALSGWVYVSNRRLLLFSALNPLLITIMISLRLFSLNSSTSARVSLTCKLQLMSTLIKHAYLEQRRFANIQVVAKITFTSISSMEPNVQWKERNGEGTVRIHSFRSQTYLQIQRSREEGKPLFILNSTIWTNLQILWQYYCAPL